MNWSCLLNDKCPQDLVAASTDCFSTWSSHPEESKFDLLYIANQLMYRYIRVHTGTYTVYTGTCTVYTGTYRYMQCISQQAVVSCLLLMPNKRCYIKREVKMHCGIRM